RHAERRPHPGRHRPTRRRGPGAAARPHARADPAAGGAGLPGTEGVRHGTAAGPGAVPRLPRPQYRRPDPRRMPGAGAGRADAGKSAGKMWVAAPVDLGRAAVRQRVGLPFTPMSPARLLRVPTSPRWVRADGAKGTGGVMESGPAIFAGMVFVLFGGA